MGNASNIKVTFPEDLTLAELILRSQGRSNAKKITKNKNNTEPPRAPSTPRNPKIRKLTSNNEQPRFNSSRLLPHRWFDSDTSFSWRPWRAWRFNSGLDLVSMERHLAR
jgi:hypothetical protein